MTTCDLVQHQCQHCQRVLFETAGELRQAVKIRCRKCGEWNQFNPERPEAAKEQPDDTCNK